jgi:hypothetical protein
MNSPETSYMKHVANELRFLMFTHMTCFNIQFGRYGILKSGSISGRFWTDFDTSVRSGF